MELQKKAVCYIPTDSLWPFLDKMDSSELEFLQFSPVFTFLVIIRIYSTVLLTMSLCWHAFWHQGHHPCWTGRMSLEMAAAWQRSLACQHSLSRGFRGINATDLSLHSVFLKKRFRCMVSKCCMPSFPVIKVFYIPENIFPRFFKISVIPVMKPFWLDCAEKCFRTGIIPAVTFPTHTPYHPMFLEFFYIFLTAILTSLVWVMNQAFWWSVPYYRVL